MVYVAKILAFYSFLRRAQMIKLLYSSVAIISSLYLYHSDKAEDFASAVQWITDFRAKSCSYFSISKWINFMVIHKSICYLVVWNVIAIMFVLCKAYIFNFSF